MKKTFFISMFMTILSCVFLPTFAQKTTPLTFQNFCKSNEIKQEFKGYYSVYSGKGKFYLEIPQKGLKKDILVTAQVVQGASSYVSPASGVIRFTLGHNHVLNMFRNMSVETAVDTMDWRMMAAIRKSGLQPVMRTFPIVAYGEDQKSPIIELTNDLENSTGLFAVNKFSLLSHPDPTRSEIEKTFGIDKGVVFRARRTQTDYVSDPNSHHGEDVANTFLLEMLLEEIPEHSVELKRDSPAYGFETIPLFEYDSQNYVSFVRNYIQRWNLGKSKGGKIKEPSIPICVYIDPLMPKPFSNALRQGVMAWSLILRKVGWKNVFRFSSDAKDASLSYKKILFRWGNAYNDNNSDLIVNPVNGEILCARVNVMDERANSLMNRYYLQCGDKDPRILTDLHNLTIRCDIFKIQIEQIMAKLLGLKSNHSASSAYTADNLHSADWLRKHGMTASVTSQLTFNYIATGSDHIDITDLMPKISTYDEDAIAFAYGNSMDPPSCKKAFYTELDKSDPYGQDILSRDIVKASSAGLESLGRIYPYLTRKVAKFPPEYNSWNTVDKLAAASVDLYDAYVYQTTNLIGGRSKRNIVPGFNDSAVTYVPKSEQIQALLFLEKNLFKTYPLWLNNDSLKIVMAVDMKDHVVNLAKSVFSKILSDDSMESLINSEEIMGSQAFTCSDLFKTLNKVIFYDFDKKVRVTPYQYSMQAVLTNVLLSRVNKQNITSGLSDVSAVLHSYFLQMAHNINYLSSNASDPESRNFYQMLSVKLDHEYFNK